MKPQKYEIGQEVYHLTITDCPKLELNLDRVIVKYHNTKEYANETHNMYDVYYDNFSDYTFSCYESELYSSPEEAKNTIQMSINTW